MTDGIIKGTGNSRYLRAPANVGTLYPTWDSALEALAAGTFPIDLNGINPNGWETVGDKMDKATLLTDSLCTALGLATTATPTQAMDKLRTLIDGKAKIETGSYYGTGTYGIDNPNILTFTFNPKLLFLWIGGYSGSERAPYYVFPEFLTEEYQRVEFAKTSTSSYYNVMKKTGNSVMWYLAAGGSNVYTNAEIQLNYRNPNSATGQMYIYCAIG